MLPQHRRSRFEVLVSSLFLPYGAPNRPGRRRPTRRPDRHVEALNGCWIDPPGATPSTRLPTQMRACWRSIATSTRRPPGPVPGSHATIDRPNPTRAGGPGFDTRQGLRPGAARRPVGPSVPHRADAAQPGHDARADRPAYPRASRGRERAASGCRMALRELISANGDAAYGTAPLSSRPRRLNHSSDALSSWSSSPSESSASVADKAASSRPAISTTSRGWRPKPPPQDPNTSRRTRGTSPPMAHVWKASPPSWTHSWEGMLWRTRVGTAPGLVARPIAYVLGAGPRVGRVRIEASTPFTSE